MGIVNSDSHTLILCQRLNIAYFRDYVFMLQNKRRHGICVYLSEATPSGSWGGSTSFIPIAKLCVPNLPLPAHFRRSPGLNFYGEDSRKVSIPERPIHSWAADWEPSKESKVPHAASFKLEHACMNFSTSPWEFSVISIWCVAEK